MSLGSSSMGSQTHAALVVQVLHDNEPPGIGCATHIACDPLLRELIHGLAKRISDSSRRAEVQGDIICADGEITAPLRNLPDTHGRVGQSSVRKPHVRDFAIGLRLVPGQTLLCLGELPLRMVEPRRHCVTVSSLPRRPFAGRTCSTTTWTKSNASVSWRLL